MLERQRETRELGQAGCPGRQGWLFLPQAGLAAVPYTLPRHHRLLRDRHGKAGTAAQRKGSCAEKSEQRQPGVVAAGESCQIPTYWKTGCEEA